MTFDVLMVWALTLVSVTAARVAEGRYLRWAAIGGTLAAALLWVWRTRSNFDEYELWLPVFVGVGISLVIFAAAGWMGRRNPTLAAHGIVTLAAGIVARYVVPLIAYLLLLATSSS